MVCIGGRRISGTSALTLLLENFFNKASATRTLTSLVENEAVEITPRRYSLHRTRPVE